MHVSPFIVLSFFFKNYYSMMLPREGPVMHIYIFIYGSVVLKATS